jgi:tetratricopeptide (TPR) repeat protein
MLQAQSQYAQAVTLTPWDVTPAIKSEIARWWAAVGRNDRQQVGESVTKNVERILRGAAPGNDPADLAQGHSDLGDIYLEQGQNERALQAFDKCVKLSPLRPQCWIHAGRARERLLDEARVMPASETRTAGYRQVADDYIQAFLLDDENADTRSGVRELVAHPEVFGVQWCSNPQLMKRLVNVDAQLGKIARRDCRVGSVPMLAARASRS